MAQTLIRGSSVIERLGRMDVDLITITPTIDAHDVLFNPIQIPYATSQNGGRSILQSICLIDQTDTSVDAGVQIDLVFTQDDTVLGSLDAAVSGADTVLDGILGIVSITNYVDMINGQVATKNNIGLVLSAISSSSSSVYVGGVIREAGTARAADAIDIRLGIVKD